MSDLLSSPGPETTTAPTTPLTTTLTTALTAADEPDRLAALHDQLAARARDESLVDVAYRTVDSPLGELLLAATPVGLVRVAFAREGHDAVLARLAALLGPRVLRSHRELDPAAAQLDDYFAGRRHGFDVPLDLRLARGFRLVVLEHLRRIPYGARESYAVVAAAAGSPRAVRAVGSACATNPLPVVVPCHRVVRTDGALGGYLGGLAAKEYLLGLESAA
ncbi:MAG TPA: methylated-DNA--[protein]-cysteine S-methyltransferase [Intrasporangium sp.]|uniref:methylated-DNA--[protein]-cysteine S-methyltransferase n=1 Tax=Intrasporangium sp. TaxID=1925024 RepID=UPI002D791525|nr:methylated-DNA--[protein]-cysteine S-methyltransferase [Intrasporangium sp.]HET7398001.1 methylated-DNA--[protein]-cysteine S-methyltransferase [Intrasporangium sp.]